MTIHGACMRAWLRSSSSKLLILHKRLKSSSYLRYTEESSSHWRSSMYNGDQLLYVTLIAMPYCIIFGTCCHYLSLPVRSHGLTSRWSEEANSSKSLIPTSGSRLREKFSFPKSRTQINPRLLGNEGGQIGGQFGKQEAQDSQALLI
jgi:hypothetical protein